MRYIRVNITAEGQTEMEFAKNTLAPYLEPFGITLQVRCVMTSKQRHKTYRGGLLDYGRAKRDIQNWIKQEGSQADVYFTTMFDLYALPNDFPVYKASLKIQEPYERIALLEQALYTDIAYPRFLPYLQLHEFEALLLANPPLLLLEYPEATEEVAQLENIVAQYQNNPELVNTGRESAPSKQIIKLIPAYQGNKVTVGATLAGIEGVMNLKEKCRHFGEWIGQLEGLNA